jgi:hypothetical protein
MATTTGNTLPLWVGTPRYEAVQIPTTATSVSGQAPGVIGTNCFLVGSITGTDGGYIQKIRFSFTSTTGAINVAATNINIFLSSINTGTPATTDTFLFSTLQVPAQTISGVTVAPIFYEVPMNIGVQQNRYILVAQTVAATTNSAWVATAILGGY